MPLFAFVPWLVGILELLVAKFVVTLGKKLALLTAYSVLMFGLVVAFTLALTALVATAHIAMPASMSILFYFLPNNFESTISIYVSARILAWVYAYKTSWVVREAELLSQ